METNENNVQEQPAPPQLYDPAEAAHIAELLCHAYKPEYIILFGSLVDSTPHSDIVAYDLLVVISEEPYYGGWAAAKRWLKLKMPPQRREIPYVNVYLHTEKFVMSPFSPCLWLARAEGEILCCSDRYTFRHPRKSFDYLKAFCEAGRHFSIFWEQGDQRSARPFCIG